MPVAIYLGPPRGHTSVVTTFKYITFRTHSHMHTGAEIMRTVPERALALPARRRRPGRTITPRAEARSTSAAPIQRHFVRSSAATAPHNDADVEELDEAADADYDELGCRRAAHQRCRARARLARSCHAHGRGQGRRRHRSTMVNRGSAIVDQPQEDAGRGGQDADDAAGTRRTRMDTKGDDDPRLSGAQQTPCCPCSGCERPGSTAKVRRLEVEIRMILSRRERAEGGRCERG